MPSAPPVDRVGALPNETPPLSVFAIIQGAGWPIWPLIIASIIALAIIGERAWSLRRTLVAPPDLLPKVVAEFRQNGAPPEMVERVASHSPLGEVLAAGLRNVRSPRDVPDVVEKW